MEEQLVIPARFCGPPESANGGYACGAVARFLDGPVEVTLRRPPPLEVAMAVVGGDGGRIEIHDDHGLVAEGRVTNRRPNGPPPVAHERAVAAARRYRGFEPGATFASCFVCSPEREDGLRIFPGPLGGGLAAPWTPDPALADESGFVPSEIVWAALDCPTFFASTEPGQLALLGRMTAVIDAEVRAGEPHVVVARGQASDGRKRVGCSAVYSADGTLCGSACATWITIDYD